MNRNWPDYFRKLKDAIEESTKHMKEGQRRDNARKWYGKGYADGYKQALQDQRAYSPDCAERDYTEGR